MGGFRTWAVAAVVAALAMGDSRVAAQLATCDTTVTNAAIYSGDALSCQAQTQYSLTPAAKVPGATQLPAVCKTPACSAFFAALSSAVPTDCLLDTLKLRSQLLDQLPVLCAPYNRSTNASTPTSGGTNSTSSSSGDTAGKVFKIIGWVIGVLVLLCLLYVAWFFFVVLYECVRGCYRCLCCISPDENDELVDDHVDGMEMAYEEIDRPQIDRSDDSKPTYSAAAKTASTSVTQSTHSSSQQSNSASISSSSGSEDAVRALLEHEAIRKARIPLAHCHVGNILSHGAYGEVLRGVFEGEPVAIKRLLPARRHDMKEIATFLEEAKIMTTLRHDNIVRLIGVTYNTDNGVSIREAMSDFSIVCELMEGGDLRSMLSHADNNNAPTGFHADNLPIAIDIAAALTYMHSIRPSPIVHRDLKSKNVLLTRDLRAKLTDFGISRERADATMTAGVGSFLWMAPEIVFGRRYDEKADVFSFGVLLSELDTHKLPYSQAIEPGSDRKLTEMMIVKMVSEGTLTVSFSENADAEVVELARACVATSALLRPSAETVLRRLVEIGERLTRRRAGVSMLEDTNAFSMTTTRRMY